MDPVSRGEQISFDINIEMVTDSTAYPESRIFWGVTPDGAYFAYKFFARGQEQPWQSPDSTLHLAMPEDWVAPKAPYAWPILFAGPYRHEIRITEGKRLHVYTFGTEEGTQRKADNIEQWTEDVLTGLGRVLGPPYPDSREWRIYELPRYHAGGMASRDAGATAFTFDLTEGLSSKTNVRWLAYHELGHLWPMAISIEEWPGAHESFTEYLSLLVSEQANGRDERDQRLLAKEDRYGGVFADHEPLISDITAVGGVSYEEHVLRYDKFTWFWHSLRFLMRNEAFLTLLRDLYTDDPAVLMSETSITVDEFAARVNRQADMDLIAYIKQWFQEPGSFNIAVSAATSAPRLSMSGGWPGWTYHNTLQIESTGSLHSPQVELLLNGAEDSVVTRVALERGTTTINLKSDFAVDEIVMDPNGWLLGVRRTPFEAEVVGPQAQLALLAVLGAGLVLLIVLYRRFTRRPVVRSIDQLP